MAERVYNRFKFRSATGLDDWDAPIDSRTLLLETTAAGAFDPDLNTVADLLAVGGVAELVATGYARKTNTGEAASEDDTNDRANLTATIPTWTALGAASGDNVVAAVIYNEGGGTDATRTLISYHDTNLVVALNGGDFTINTPADVLRLT